MPKPNDKCPCGSGKKYKKCCYCSVKAKAASSTVWTEAMQSHFDATTTHSFKLSELFHGLLYDDLPSVGVGASSRHGRGLFAMEDIPAWTVATTYPVHFVCGRMQGKTFVIGRGEKVEAEVVEAYQLDLQPNDDVNEGLPYTVSVSANPNLCSGGLGHLVNDAGCMTSLSRPQLEAYVEAFEASANCTYYHVGSYGIGIVTTKEVKAGDELLMTYGVGYWFKGDDYKMLLSKHAAIAMPFYRRLQEQQRRCMASFEFFKEREGIRQSMKRIMTSF
jgi:hypothetical protein